MKVSVISPAVGPRVSPSWLSTLNTGSAKNGLFLQVLEIGRHGVGRKRLAPHGHGVPRDLEQGQPDEVRKRLEISSIRRTGPFWLVFSELMSWIFALEARLLVLVFPLTSSMMDFKRSASRRAFDDLVVATLAAPREQRQSHDHDVGEAESEPAEEENVVEPRAGRKERRFLAAALASVRRLSPDQVASSLMCRTASPTATAMASGDSRSNVHLGATPSRGRDIDPPGRGS